MKARERRKRAMLALADGRVFSGYAFGAIGEAVGELVFNTAMTGYQEVLTDPSYCGQLVCMTYPEIGNVGVNEEDAESARVYVEGLIVKECWSEPSNWRSQLSLDEYLERQGVPGIEGIDTRALVLHIRQHGAQQGVLSSVDLDPQSLVGKARNAPSMVGRDLVSRVTSGDVYDWELGEWELGRGFERPSLQDLRDRPRLIAVDYGIKRSILRRLTAAGFRVTVVPASAPPDEILALGPDAIFLSNGPGDPAALPYARDTVAALLGKRPIFGICLGHQIMALALGAETYKLEFGHHGTNHPVLDVKTGRVEITSQNHGFAVRAASLGDRAELSHINLNDRTVEGLRGLGAPFFSVQYHPEASPGPHDANYLFRRLYRLTELFPRYGAQALERLEAELASCGPRSA